MTVKLVYWLTRYDVCGTRLRSSGSPPIFKPDDVDNFDRTIRGDWGRRSIPLEVTRELEREARGTCALCDDSCDRLEQAHIQRKGIELSYYCQHPSNLLSVCPNCHSRYDSDLISFAAVEHAKELRQAKLMERIDRDAITERVVREAIRSANAAGLDFVSGVPGIVKAATGRVAKPESRLEAVSMLMQTAGAVSSDQPLTGSLVLGLAHEGNLDEDIDSSRYIETLAQPFPSRAEFDDEFDGHAIHDGHDPSPSLVAWAAHADAAYECGVCSTICVDPEGLTDALVEHWKCDRSDEDEDDEEFDEDAVREEALNTIVNSGVECGDLFGGSRCCSYHAYQMSKDD